MPINFAAVLPAAVASWIAGALWFSVLGGLWRRALGAAALNTPKRVPVGPMVLAFVGELVMALMLSGLIGHFAATLRAALIVAGGVWLGFVATSVAVNNAFQQRSIMLTLIDSGHWLAVLLAQAAVISALN